MIFILFEGWCNWLNWCSRYKHEMSRFDRRFGVDGVASGRLSATSAFLWLGRGGQAARFTSSISLNGARVRLMQVGSSGRRHGFVTAFIGCCRGCIHVFLGLRGRSSVGHNCHVCSSLWTIEIDLRRATARDLLHFLGALAPLFLSTSRRCYHRSLQAKASLLRVDSGCILGGVV